MLRRLRRGPADRTGPVEGAPSAAVPDPQRVVVVTDSTASLPSGAAERWGIEVVPLEVAIGDARYREGVDLTTADLLAALTGGTRVTTSQPPPLAFAQAYARAAERGAREVVSVHLSGELSGTVRAAGLAAAAAPVPVHVVDSRSVAMGLGFAVLAAAEVARGAGGGSVGVKAGGDDGAHRGDVADRPDGTHSHDGADRADRARAADEAAAAGDTAGSSGRRDADSHPRPGAVDGVVVADRARVVAASASALFLVDSLDHLRRGGRIGTAAAAVGTLLGMRPMLEVRAGRVEVAAKVRTRRAARERLLALALDEVAERGAARVAVHYLGQPELAESLAAEVRERCALRPEAVMVSEVSAVVGAHAGPGLLGVVVADA